MWVSALGLQAAGEQRRAGWLVQQPVLGAVGIAFPGNMGPPAACGKQCVQILGPGSRFQLGSTYLEGSGYRPQRQSHGLFRCTSVSVCVCVPGLVVGEEGSGGRAGPESRSAERLTSPKRAFGSLAGRQAEGGGFLMSGREPWKMGDPHTLSSPPPGCHPRDIGTPTCCTSASPLGQFRPSSLVAG